MESMSQNSGYIKNVTRFILQDGVSEIDPESRLRKMQICKTGKFFDPRYGKFEITLTMLSEMVSNFEKGVRGVVPALDYKHEADDVAAGWFKKLYIQNDSELWAEVEMTPKGEKVLSDKEFGYISAEFEDQYTDNESGKKHGCVLLGAGLTNRPVLKRMKPVVQLSETEDQGDQMKKLEDMNLEEMKKYCQELEAKNKELMDKMKPEAPAEKPAEMKPEEDPEMEKKLEIELAQAKKELAEANEKIALVEKTATFTKLLSEGKACEAQRESFIAGDMAAFIEKAVPFKLNEQGHANKAEPTVEKSAEDEVLEKATKLAEENKISMKDAIAQVLIEDKKLSEKVNG